MTLVIFQPTILLMETKLPIPNTSGISEKLRSIFSGKLILKLLLAIFIIYLLRSTFVFVPAGHVGVKYDRGSGVLNSTLKEGLNLSIPYWQTVTLFDARLQEYTMSVVPDEGALLRDDSLDAPTSDGQQVTIDERFCLGLTRIKFTRYLNQLVQIMLIR